MITNVVPSPFDNMTVILRPAAEHGQPDDPLACLPRPRHAAAAIVRSVDADAK
jgi:hypothetical protein